MGSCRFSLLTSKTRCIGVFDTVGALGLPSELTFVSKRITKLFGFSDNLLGDHIQYAFHAIAVNETRKDFVRPQHRYRTCHRLLDMRRRMSPSLSRHLAGEKRAKSLNKFGSQVSTLHNAREVLLHLLMPEYIRVTLRCTLDVSA